MNEKLIKLASDFSYFEFEKLSKEEQKEFRNNPQYKLIMNSVFPKIDFQKPWLQANLDDAVKSVKERPAWMNVGIHNTK